MERHGTSRKEYMGCRCGSRTAGPQEWETMWGTNGGAGGPANRNMGNGHAHTIHQRKGIERVARRLNVQRVKHQNVTNIAFNY